MQVSLPRKTHFKTNHVEHPPKLHIEKNKPGQHLNTSSVKMLGLW